MIDRMSEALSKTLVGNKFLQIPMDCHSMENFISHGLQKNSISTAQNLQDIKSFLTLKWSQYRKSGSAFPSSKPIAVLPAATLPAASAAHRCQQRLLAVCCLQRLQQSKPSIILWNSLEKAFWSDCQPLSWPAGDRTWSQTCTLQHDQRAVNVLCAQKSLNKLCGVWILFVSVENLWMQKLRLAVSQFQPSSSSTSRLESWSLWMLQKTATNWMLG